MAFTQEFNGGIGGTGNAFWSANGAYVESNVTVPAGNTNLAGSRPLVINSISPETSGAATTWAIRLGGTLYGAGSTIADSPGGSLTGFIRLTKTTTGDSFFKRKATPGYSITLNGVVPASTVYQNNSISGSYTYYTVPTAPASVTITSKVGTTVNLSYSNPSSDGGSGITSYTAQYRQNGGAWAGTKAVSGNAFSFADLVPGSTYDFRVYANNAAGASTATVSASTLVAAYGTLRRGADFVPITVGKLYRAGAWRNIITAKVYRGGAWRNITNV